MTVEASVVSLRIFLFSPNFIFSDVLKGEPGMSDIFGGEPKGKPGMSDVFGEPGKSDIFQGEPKGEPDAQSTSKSDV